MKSLKRLDSIRGLGIVIMLLVLIPMVVTSTGWAQKVDPNYFKGKTIEIVVPMAAGGGADIGARFLSNWLPKFIPGNPLVIVVNMPGANGMLGSNHVYNVAKKDGTTMLNTSGAVNLISLLQLKGCNYNLDKMPKVIVNSSSYIHIAKGNVYKDFKELFEKELLIYGHLPPGGGTTTSFLLGKELLGIKVKKLVLAYQGSGDARRAYTAGEINSTTETILGYPGYVAPLEKTGETKILWQTGTLDVNGLNIRVDPPLGHVPTIADRYKEAFGKLPSGKIWEAHKAVSGAIDVFDKILCLPPGTPQGVVDIVADACDKMAKDSSFVAEAENKMKVSYMSGEKMMKLWDKIMVGTDPNAIAWLRTWLKEKWGVE